MLRSRFLFRHTPDEWNAEGSGKSQPSEGKSDQAQHQGAGATDYSIAAAGTTVGDGQNKAAIDRGD
jgi:hypothetical protein